MSPKETNYYISNLELEEGRSGYVKFSRSGYINAWDHVYVYSLGKGYADATEHSSENHVLDSDYYAVREFFSLKPGESSKDILVSTINEGINDPDETIMLAYSLNGYVGNGIPNSNGRIKNVKDRWSYIKIKDDDPLWNSVNAPGIVSEGDTFNVSFENKGIRLGSSIRWSIEANKGEIFEAVSSDSVGHGKLINITNKSRPLIAANGERGGFSFGVSTVENSHYTGDITLKIKFFSNDKLLQEKSVLIEDNETAPPNRITFNPLRGGGGKGNLVAKTT